MDSRHFEQRDNSGRVGGPLLHCAHKSVEDIMRFDMTGIGCEAGLKEKDESLLQVARALVGPLKRAQVTAF